MISLKFCVTNPWSDRFESLYSSAGKTLIKHKVWEFQILRTDELLAIDLRCNIRGDHAGLDIWSSLLSYSLNFKIYDSRHWNYESSCWENSIKG
jgi:hypothetical protein